MESYELHTLDATLIDRLRKQAAHDAPWAGWTDQAWDFLALGAEHGIRWQIHDDVLLAYQSTGSKTALARQARARENLRYSHDATNVWPSGVGLLAKHRLGHYQKQELEPSNDDSPTLTVFMPDPDAATKMQLLGTVMAVFWPDAPPLIWQQVLEHLVRRDQETSNSMYGGHEEYALDYMDFGRVFRFLAHADKLAAHPVQDWSTIINPPAASVACAPKPSRTRTR